MKKPRKKYNAKAARARMYTTVAESALNRLALYGSSVCKTAVCALGPTTVTATYETVRIAAEVVVDELIESARTWHGWLMFTYHHEVDGELEITPVCMTVSIEDATLPDFADNLEHTIQRFKPEGDEPTGYAFWFSPTNNYELDVMSEGLERYWMGVGVDIPERQLPPEERKISVEGIRYSIMRRNVLPFKIKKETDTVPVVKE